MKEKLKEVRLPGAPRMFVDKDTLTHVLQDAEQRGYIAWDYSRRMMAPKGSPEDRQLGIDALRRVVESAADDEKLLVNCTEQQYLDRSPAGEPARTAE